MEKDYNFVLSKPTLYLVFFIIALFFSLPPFFGFLQTPFEHTFTGVRALVPGDTFVYYQYLYQVADGELLFSNLYSVEPSLKFLNVFWLFSGLIRALFQFTPAFTFALLRFIFGFGLIAFVYYLLERLLLKKNVFLTFLFITFSSGLGMYYLFYNLSFNELLTPMDLWVPDITLPLTLAHSPHTILSTILLFVELYFGYRAITERSYRTALFVGISTLFHIQFH